MQKNQPSGKHDSIDEMDRLIKSIKEGDRNIQEKELAVRLGYAKGYFSECRSRNFAPNKLLNSLRAQAGSLQNTNKEPPQERDNNWHKIAEANLINAKSIAEMVAMLKQRDELLSSMQANLNQIPTDMVALTAKVMEGQRELAEQIGALASGTSGSKKTSPSEKPQRTDR